MREVRDQWSVGRNGTIMKLFFLAALFILGLSLAAFARPTSHIAVIGLATRICPYSASGLADGCQAIAGIPQRPTILLRNRYRPPWNVAGVDYRVGATGVFTDWRNLSDPNLTVNLSTGQVSVFAGFAGFDHVDFSLGRSANIYNGATGATTLFITDCKFAAPAGTTDYPFYSIQDQRGAALTLKRNSFDGTYMTGLTSFIGAIAGGDDIIQWNWFKNTRQHNVELVGDGTFNLIDKYNLIDINNFYVDATAHPNWLQEVGTTATNTIDVRFNTAYHYDPVTGTVDSGEGFQFEGDATYHITATLANNTMVSELSASGNVTNSYIIHGHLVVAGNPSGSTNTNNYFDVSGAFGAYYPGSVTPALNWTNSGNIDMPTGAIITPP